MKNILIFGMTNNPGGVESFIMNYCKEMCGSIQFDFLTYDVHPAFEEEIRDVIRGNIYTVTGKRKNILMNRKELNSFFKENSKKYDAIWVNLCELSSIEPLIYAKKYGINHRIIHSHNSKNMSSLLAKVLHKINKFRIVNIATDYWACSEVAGEFFYNKNVLETDRYHIVNNAIVTEKFKFNQCKRDELRKKLNVEDKIVIGHVGRLHSQKNPFFIVEIIKELVTVNSNIMMLWIGTGELLEGVEQKVKEYGIEQYVSFLGTRKDIPDLMNAMDVFLLPSLYEGLPVVLVEAQTSGLPCAVSDTVTQEVKILDDCRFIGLDKSPMEWGKEILNLTQREKNREYAAAQVEEAGYNIATEAEKLMQELRREKDEEN